MAPASIHPKCLFFDVFGTCVDWRWTVIDTLESSCKEALKAKDASISQEVRSKAEAMTRDDWADFAQKWRNSYLAFTRSIAADPSKAYKTVDEHHMEALQKLLAEQGLAGSSTDALYTDAQLQDLNLVWHRLRPWPDTCAGLSELNKVVSRTCTLTNGNLTLIGNMVAHGKMPFTDVYSAEMFQSYKPSGKVYLGAAEKAGFKPEECAMVAAHLDDLKAAKSFGLRCIYVERSQEERHPELRDEGIPDIWVKEDEDGFVEVARRLAM